MTKKGETRERILSAATRVFFEYGFEAASVKMILEEADVVTGSFYHFFPSKEALFECVVDRFLRDYAQRASAVLEDDSLDAAGQLSAFLREMQRAFATYYRILQGNRLHWTIQHALHNRTVEALVPPLSGLLGRLMDKGMIESRLAVDTTTLAAVLIKGTEAILHANAQDLPEYGESDAAQRRIRAYIGLLVDVCPG